MDKEYRICKEENQLVVERLIFPRFWGVINFERNISSIARKMAESDPIAQALIASNITELKLLDDCRDYNELAKAINECGAFLEKIKNEGFEKYRNTSPIVKVKKNDIYYYAKNWLNIDFNPEYIKHLLRCIEYCRPDMYFNYLFSLTAEFDFDDQYSNGCFENRILPQYKQIALRILEEDCHVLQTPIDRNHLKDNFYWEIHYLNYRKEIDSFKSTILDYVNFNHEIYSVLNIQKKENPYLNENSMQFFQNTMFFGFHMALKRIEDEINSTSLFGTEIIDYDNRTYLIIYLTPLGLLNGTLLRCIEKEARINLFNKHLEKIGFQRIYDDSRMKKLSTSAILEREGVYYYHIQPSYDFSNSFIQKKLNMPYMSSLFVQSQAHYLQIK